jgi:hypothetical protein
MFHTKGGENTYELIEVYADGSTERRVLNLDKEKFFLYQRPTDSNEEKLIRATDSDEETLHMLGRWWSMEFSARQTTDESYGNC